jgi:uncharacterized protein YgiM (DUF1202 family)
MKRIIWWAGLVILLVAGLGQAEERMVYVNVPSVNIRAEAGTQYEIIRSVSNGYPLKVLAEQEKWYQVELKDKVVGWVYKTMVTSDMPDAAKIARLESKLKLQAADLAEAKHQLQLQIKLNSKLDKQLAEARAMGDELARQNQKLKERERVKLAGIGIGILLLGWGFGFVTGFFRRQAEDKRFIKMMIEANSLKK